MDSEPKTENDDQRALTRRALDFEELRDEPTVLWHYTSMSACLAILSSDTLHLTNAQYLNDSVELVHFFDHLDSNRDAYFVANTADDVDKYWIPNSGFNEFLPIKDPDFTPAFFSELRRSREGILTKHICVGSFSEDGDLLSQWRAYGRSGTGVAIGFNVSSLAELATRNMSLLRNCRYLRNDRDYHITKFIQATQTMLGDFEAFHAACVQIAARYKHTAFSEEKEWRVITDPRDSDDPSIKFRATEQMPVPYYELKFTDLKESLVVAVRVGPGLSQDLACKSIEAIGKRYGHPLSVARSAVPYRPHGP